jgi:Transposase DDE domain group 1
MQAPLPTSSRGTSLAVTPVKRKPQLRRAMQRRAFLSPSRRAVAPNTLPNYTDEVMKLTAGCAVEAMTDATPLPFDLPSVRRKKLTVDFAGGNQSSNGSVLLLREAERKHGVCLRLAEAMPGHRGEDRHQARDEAPENALAEHPHRGAATVITDCQRGQMENLIKLHKAQLSCHNATANQVRLALHTAAFWLMHCVRSAIPQTNPLARCEFATHRFVSFALDCAKAGVPANQSAMDRAARLYRKRIIWVMIVPRRLRVSLLGKSCSRAYATNSDPFLLR